jgi:alpha-galactosidase
MAALCESNLRFFDLAAQAAIEKSKDLATEALMLDPLSAAVATPADIRAMAEEMFEAEKDFLPGFH